ncbi:NTPase [Saltwater crocodilepox virus]|nr:NTPase [Saltwater crocodilepox virus]AVD69480.1 NTPase [Saltwater crocodilepox virus]QGT46583.1 ORF145 [Saltwater crocodilepox virus]QGT46799.1 ORF145 [Saltwater crocodilepox virus]QGT47015.1 ORF145 [Saltwater crocodilepox virus]
MELNNRVIFVLKRIGVSREQRASGNLNLCESFLVPELEEYIRARPECTLFECLKNEEENSRVRVFFDVDLREPLVAEQFAESFKTFLLLLTKFLADFVFKHCAGSVSGSKRAFLVAARSRYSLSLSDDPEKVSFHLIFTDMYTSVRTLVAMRRFLSREVRSSVNPLMRAVDVAVYRRNPSLRVVGTRKTPECRYVHRMTASTDLADYLYTYVDVTPSSYVFEYAEAPAPDRAAAAAPGAVSMSFDKILVRLQTIVGNEITNLDRLNANTLPGTPLIIDYRFPCRLCGKASHKHPHHVAVQEDSLRIFKAGNPNSCRVKTVPLAQNKLFAISERIMEAGVVHKNKYGEYIAWIAGRWETETDNNHLTRLVLSMKDAVDDDEGLVLVPSNRRIIENNLKDMITSCVATDLFPEKLQFDNGILDVATREFHRGEEGKDFVCTVSTGYEYAPTAAEDPAVAELRSVLDDIQPPAGGNAANREIFERVLSSCLCGVNKPYIFFFYGDTSSGKSTVKKLLRSVFDGLFTETSQCVLVEPFDKGPNPYVSSIHLKRVTFCSELPDFSCNNVKKIRSDNVKKLTENCIVGRACFSNKISNCNVSTIIIDSNYKPVFDKVDNAIMRRIGLIHFKTHFSPNLNRPCLGNSYDVVKKLNAELESKIRTNYFRGAFLTLLLEWYAKHHLHGLSLEPTPELIPDFRFRLTLDTIIAPSDSTHAKHMPSLVRRGYHVSEAGLPALSADGFRTRLVSHFNVKIYGSDIDGFISKNKKYTNFCDEYMEYVFIEDLGSK